jgi:conjugative transfer signal peptidase TraF
VAKSSQFERIAGYVLFSLATSYAAWIAAVHFGLRFNVEPSVPIGAYRVVSGPVERGDTVGACLPSALAHYALERQILPHGSCPTGVLPLVKVVAAISGDRVDVTDAAIYVNGRLWPYSAIRRRSCYGQRIDMRLPSGRYIIAANKVFLMGLNPCSYDARYWPAGSVTRSMVARWNPLITLPQKASL